MSSAHKHLYHSAHSREGHASTSLVMFFVAALFVLLFGPIAGWCAVPSQVLMLYNADWTDDAFLTEPGQDSKEIAEHYVRMTPIRKLVN